MRFFIVDLVFVIAFVLIGRASHDEQPVLGALGTLWPFTVGLLVGWVLCRGWRAPLALARTALPVWIATVIAGMLLRLVSGQGVQPSFVVVAAIVLAVFLLGWRVIVAPVRRRHRA